MKNIAPAARARCKADMLPLWERLVWWISPESSRPLAAEHELDILPGLSGPLLLLWTLVHRHNVERTILGSDIYDLVSPMLGHFVNVSFCGNFRGLAESQQIDRRFTGWGGGL